MSEINNTAWLEKYGAKCKALMGSAVKGLNQGKVQKTQYIIGHFRDDLHSQSVDWCKTSVQTKSN